LIRRPTRSTLSSSSAASDVYKRQRYAIGGNWLGLGVSTFANTGQYDSHGDYAPYTTAPNSPHIMWTKPVAFGGTVGGDVGNSQQSNYWSTSQYQPKFAPIIINDVLSVSYTHLTLPTKRIV